MWNSQWRRLHATNCGMSRHRHNMLSNRMEFAHYSIWLCCGLWLVARWRAGAAIIVRTDIAKVVVVGNCWLLLHGGRRWSWWTSVFEALYYTEWCLVLLFHKRCVPKIKEVFKKKLNNCINNDSSV